MKVALVRARYSPFGGAERFAARALDAMAAHGGVELAVLARRWQGERGATTVRFVRCDPFYVGSVWRDASFAASVHAHLATEAFDLVQSHERIPGLPVYRAGDGVHAAWLERRSRHASFATRLGIALNPHHRYLVRVERAMFEHPALRAVICNSEMVRREILARFAIAPEKLVLVRNGIDLERFSPSVRTTHRATVRERLAIGRDVPVFVAVGSGFERKGVGPAIDALAAIESAVLIVVGDDKHRDRYEAQAGRLGVASRVRFVGTADDPRPYLGAADAFVLPTLYDPFPNAALEAFACGLPVITTDACGAAEVVEEGVNGWVVPVGAVGPLADAMRTVAALDEAGHAAAAIAARRTALPLSLDALSRSLRALYARLMATEGPVLNSPAP